MRTVLLAAAVLVASFASCGGHQAVNPYQGWIRFQQLHTGIHEWSADATFLRADGDLFTRGPVDGPCEMVGDEGTPYDPGPAPGNQMAFDYGKLTYEAGATFDFPGEMAGDAPWQPGATVVVRGSGSPAVPAFTLPVVPPKRPTVEPSPDRIARSDDFVFVYHTDSSHMFVSIGGTQAPSSERDRNHQLFAQCTIPVNGGRGVIPSSVLQRFAGNQRLRFRFAALNLRHEPVGRFTVRIEASNEADDAPRDVLVD